MLKEGILVEIFKDWENNKDSLGIALLERRIKFGLPFFPDYISDQQKNNDRNPILFNWELWKVKFIETTDLGKYTLERTYRHEFKIRTGYDGKSKTKKKEKTP